MLSCKDINSDADQYIDGELGFTHRLAVGFHLLMCVHCRRYIRQLTLTIATLRQMRHEIGSDGQTQQIIDRLLADETQDKN